jgi:ankyrin repeat protein
VAELVGEGVPVDARNEQHRTALDLAVWADQVAVVRLLLSLGADPEQRIGEYHETYPLRFVAGRGMHEMAAALLEGGALPEGHPFDSGLWHGSPAWMAASRGATGILEMLLDRGVSLEGREAKGGKPLVAAVRDGHPETVRFLLERGAWPLPEAVTAAERSLAISAAHPETTCASTPALLAAVAEAIALVKAAAVGVRSMENVAALTLAAEAGDTGQVAELAGQGVPVDAQNLQGRTALDLAVGNDQVAVVRLLLDLGADPEQRVGEHHETYPLRWAAGRGRPDLVAALLEGGAAPGGHPNELGFWQESPAWMAASRGATGILEMLLDHGASIDGSDAEGGKPLLAAVCEGHPDTVRLLLERGARPLPEAVTAAEDRLAAAAATHAEGHNCASTPPAQLAAFTEAIALVKDALAGVTEQE